MFMLFPLPIITDDDQTVVNGELKPHKKWRLPDLIRTGAITIWGWFF